jgi:hypothetical protein
VIINVKAEINFDGFAFDGDLFPEKREYDDNVYRRSYSDAMNQKLFIYLLFSIKRFLIFEFFSKNNK